MVDFAAGLGDIAIGATLGLITLGAFNGADARQSLGIDGGITESDDYKNGVGAGLLGTFAVGKLFANEAPLPTMRENSAPKAGGAARAALYGDGWATASIDDAVAGFAGPNPVVTTTTTGKVIYAHPETGIQVIKDVSGGYFRIRDPSINGKRSYLDLNGNVPNNKTLENGSQMGRTQSEYNQVTHFRIDG